MNKDTKTDTGTCPACHRFAPLCECQPVNDPQEAKSARETAPTPGKWREQVRERMHTTDSTTYDIVSHARKGATLIAIVECDGITSEEATANAYILAASKDLLERLEMLTNIATHPKATKAQIRMIAEDGWETIRRAKAGA